MCSLPARTCPGELRGPHNDPLSGSPVDQPDFILFFLCLRAAEYTARRRRTGHPPSHASARPGHSTGQSPRPPPRLRYACMGAAAHAVCPSTQTFRPAHGPSRSRVSRPVRSPAREPAIRARSATTVRQTSAASNARWHRGDYLAATACALTAAATPAKGTVPPARAADSPRNAQC